MVRAAAALSVLAVVVLGVGGVVGLAGDEPAVLLALVGTALCALGCVRGPRSAAAAPAAVVVPGRLAREVVAGGRQHHPDTPGRPRPRAPGLLPVT
jgi:hypothetical protein